jgi:hypothetical protein
MTIPLPSPPKITSGQPMTAHADTLRAISEHLTTLNGHINRLSQQHDRVVAALKSEPPPGVSRLDWISHMLNEDTF